MNADPSELNDDEPPSALVVATARIALAVTMPPRTFRLAVSATLACTASAGVAVTVLLLEVRITLAWRMSPVSTGTLTARA